jgi:hypothetical protein
MKYCLAFLLLGAGIIWCPGFSAELTSSAPKNKDADVVRQQFTNLYMVAGRNGSTPLIVKDKKRELPSLFNEYTRATAEIDRAMSAGCRKSELTVLKKKQSSAEARIIRLVGSRAWTSFRHLAGTDAQPSDDPIAISKHHRNLPSGRRIVY